MQKGFLTPSGHRTIQAVGQAVRRAGGQAVPQREDSGVADGRVDLRKGNAARARAMLDVVIDDDVSHDDARRERRGRGRGEC